MRTHLRRTMGIVGATLWLAGSSACIAPSAPVQARYGGRVVIGAVLDAEEEGTRDAPEAVDRALAAAVQKRALEPVNTDGAALATSIGGVRTPAYRVAKTVAAADGELVLVVSSRAAFYAQVAGRYRWTVTAEIQIAPTSDPERVLIETVEIPVFLLHYHEQEDEALASAAPLLERKVGALLDTFLDAQANAK